MYQSILRLWQNIQVMINVSLMWDIPFLILSGLLFAHRNRLFSMWLTTSGEEKHIQKLERTVKLLQVKEDIFTILIWSLIIFFTTYRKSSFEFVFLFYQNNSWFLRIFSWKEGCPAFPSLESGWVQKPDTLLYVWKQYVWFALKIIIMLSLAH